MKITELSLRRPVTTVMVFVCLAAIGLISARLLPLEYFPDIQFPGIFIQVPYQGSSPQETERLITKPIEEALGTLSGIKHMQSTSTENDAQIFLWYGWDADVAVRGLEVKDKLDSIRQDLPSDVKNILINKGSTSDQPILQLRLSSDRDLSDSYNMLERLLKRRLERLDGVSKVNLYGVEPHEIKIELLADRIAAHHVDLNKLYQTLRNANFSMTAGNITSDGQRFLVHPIGEFRSIDDIRNLIVGPDQLRLRDVARVAIASPERTYGRHLDRHYAIGLDIFKETGANMVNVSERALAEIDKIKELPQMHGIRLFFLDNQADGVKKSLDSLLNSGLFGALLSLVVLYLFLRQLSTTLMVTLAVPFSLLIALAVMYFMGISLNILSMMGLMLAVGMLVDNAVVVSENIFHHRLQKPGDAFGASLRGTREVGLAVTAGTLTTVIVFLPNLFGVQTNVTVFLKHVSIAIVVSLLASLLISQTMIPMIAARLPAPKPRPGDVGGRGSAARRYMNLLDWSLRHRWYMIGLIVLVVITAAIPMKIVKKDMFPQNDTRRLFMQYNLNGTYSVPTVERAVNKIEAYLYAHQKEFEIRSVYSYYDTGQAQTSILLTEGAGAKKSPETIADEIRKGLPKIAIGKPTFGFNRSGTTEGLKVEISGESSQVLAGLAPDMVRVLSTVKGITDVHADTGEGETEVRIKVDRDRALRAGLSTRDIATAVSVALRGLELPKYRGKDGEVTVRLAYQDSDKQTLEQLRDLQIRTADGSRLPLSALATFSVEQGPASVQHMDRRTSLDILGTLDKGVTMDEVRPRIKKIMDSVNLPPGYQWSYGQGFQDEDETGRVMVQNMLLAAMLIYIVMAALFESLLHPAAIISGIVFSIIGVFWFFLVTGTTFSLMAMIGILILMGVVVNNGIVMVDHINHLRRSGLGRHAAIVQAAGDRIRPILMTVSTTILGLIPLAIGDTQIGGDGPPYYPMARAIIGGLAFSTLVSLLVLPTIYVLLDDLGFWAKARWSTARDFRLARLRRGSDAG